ncbi:MAG: F0F1 ATP synthase subunit alpha, partial [candidate division Zixibacteria bacterium]|nr:F0F1 ATP synthase subunit alpha [candidate division Zixibacteria bacterium]
MGLNPEEVSSVIKQQLEQYESKLEMKSVGRVLQVGDGIARIWGLEDVQMSELIEFPNDVVGMV